VGAAFGLFTIFLAAKVGRRGKVIAFEPNPKLCFSIHENASLNDFSNVEVIQIALGKETANETLAFPSANLGIGSMEKHERDRILTLKDCRTIQVYVDSIDNQVFVQKLAKPDFVKIDVQALELDVLVGMDKTIDKYKPKILVEVHYIPNIDWKTENTENILKFLMSKGYSIYHVESGNIVQTVEEARNIEADNHLYAY